MTTERAFIDYLRDILDAADKAEQFAREMDLAQFVADEKTHFAVIRALEIISKGPSCLCASASLRLCVEKPCGLALNGE